jgi:hypothetical protein
MRGEQPCDPARTLAAVSAGEVLEIFVDYSLVGIGRRRFQTRVKVATRRQLRPGDTVVVHGDDVATAQARVLVVADDRPDVELELIGG